MNVNQLNCHFRYRLFEIPFQLHLELLELNLLKNLIFLEINWAWELTDVNPTFMRRNRLNPQLCGHFCSYIESYKNKFG